MVSASLALLLLAGSLPCMRRLDARHDATRRAAVSPIRRHAARRAGRYLSRHARRRSVSLARSSVDASQTQRWIEAQNALAQPYLEAIPGARDDQAAPDAAVELRALRHSRASAAAATSICATTACRIRACCTSPTRCDAQPRVLLDPNTLSKDATIALGEFVPSPDGKLLAYSLSDGGTDWRTWHFRDVATGKDLPDVLRFIKFVPVAWTADSQALSTTRAIRCAPTARGDDTQAARSLLAPARRSAGRDDPLIFKVDRSSDAQSVRADLRRRSLPGHLAVRRLAVDRHLLSQARRATARPPARSCG